MPLPAFLFSPLLCTSILLLDYCSFPPVHPVLASHAWTSLYSVFFLHVCFSFYFILYNSLPCPFSFFSSLLALLFPLRSTQFLRVPLYIPSFLAVISFALTRTLPRFLSFHSLFRFFMYSYVCWSSTHTSTSLYSSSLF